MLIPENWGDSNHNFYQYQYFFDFEDKVYYTQSDKELSNNLLEVWKDVRNNNDAYYNHLPGIKKCELYYYNDEFDKTPIADFLKEHMSNILQRRVVDVDIKKDFWINVQKSDEIVPIHDHPGLYSFSWYLDIPEEIREECLVQPEVARTRGLIQFISSRTNNKMEFNPKTNDVFIFKSNHLHHVYPFYTDNTRIVMAGNIHSITFEDGETITS